jgi:hypothetical protein
MENITEISNYVSKFTQSSPSLNTWLLGLRISRVNSQK